MLLRSADAEFGTQATQAKFTETHRSRIALACGPALVEESLRNGRPECSPNVFFAFAPVETLRCEVTASATERVEIEAKVPAPVLTFARQGELLLFHLDDVPSDESMRDGYAEASGEMVVTKARLLD